MINNEPLDLGTVANMLNFISAECDRETWTRVLMAIKSEFGDSGKGVAQDWSATAESFKQDAFNATWKSIKAGGGVTIATLVSMAKDNGFKFAPMSKADKQRLRDEQKQRKAQRKQEEEQQKRETALNQRATKAQAVDMLARAVRCNPEHPYLNKKGVIGSPLDNVYQIGLNLIVPVYQFTDAMRTIKRPYEPGITAPEYEPWNLQQISATGFKWFLKSGRVKGGFFPVRLSYECREFILCEGVATGLTIAGFYERYANVICAFNAANLKPVAQAFKQAFPTAAFTIAADNDRDTERTTGVNVGLVKAKAAAKAIDCVMNYPEFAESEAGSDWNDRFLLDCPQGLQRPVVGRGVAVNEIWGRV
ncbi:PriCT-2 domain-containing protein [Thiomicrorhabdus xiamenensis]|uniref:PriCT-2 domain-containing protein n=1 Tax=Thiomicrorhabdus xiamenensis TaxID=2739063 RepID=A0A7D4P5I3_9GAMM|nr:PriCT-2 domain-containing protein [Thiomicrorhabdus xiamenensis]QKI89916.1 PriCT-2 domain-containing protein [Thiomicrorhabdus xiamenensis]